MARHSKKATEPTETVAQKVSKALSDPNAESNFDRISNAVKTLATEIDRVEAFLGP